MSKDTRRLKRQFEAMARAIPASRGPIYSVLTGRLRLLRLPIAILLVLGGIFSFLPVLGIWMLPLGLLLLAVDVPMLRTPMSRLSIRTRRYVQLRRRRWSRRGGRAH